MRTTSLRAIALACTLMTAGAGNAWADQAMDKRIDELERQIKVLAEELGRVKEAQVIPETTELKSEWGMGPAASKVYGVESGLSIAGYGEFNFAHVEGGDDTADFLRLVTYLGYKFSDKILLNTEIEYEHASTGKSGSVSVEFAYLDFLVNQRANVRAGLVLVPVGFVNEMHEPPFYHGNQRPIVERLIIPSTWSANGLGLFGELAPGLSYRSYVVTSLDASGFSSGDIRGGRQKGSKELANDFSWVGRLDWEPTPELLLGASAYLGDQGQDGIAADMDSNPVTADVEADVCMQMYEAHLQYRSHGLELRALGVTVDLDDADVLSTANGKTIGSTMEGWYAEIAYDLMPVLSPGSDQYLAPWLRYSALDTNADVPAGFSADPSADRELLEVGVAWKPISNVVIKLDWRDFSDAKTGSDPGDELRLGAGFVF